MYNLNSYHAPIIMQSKSDAPIYPHISYQNKYRLVYRHQSNHLRWVHIED